MSEELLDGVKMKNYLVIRIWTNFIFLNDLTKL